MSLPAMTVYKEKPPTPSRCSTTTSSPFLELGLTAGLQRRMLIHPGYLQTAYELARNALIFSAPKP